MTGTKRVILGDSENHIKDLIVKWCPPDRVDEFMDDLYKIIRVCVEDAAQCVFRGLGR